MSGLEQHNIMRIVQSGGNQVQIHLLPNRGVKCPAGNDHRAEASLHQLPMSFSPEDRYILTAYVYRVKDNLINNSEKCDFFPLKTSSISFTNNCMPKESLSLIHFNI